MMRATFFSQMTRQAGKETLNTAKRMTSNNSGSSSTQMSDPTPKAAQGTSPKLDSRTYASFMPAAALLAYTAYDFATDDGSKKPSSNSAPLPFRPSV